MVECDGGGGPLGHPRIFINTDKPKICWCTYCGIPYVSGPFSWRIFTQYRRLRYADHRLIMMQANEHHRHTLEAQPKTTYPLQPTGHVAEVSESQRITDGPLEQR